MTIEFDYDPERKRLAFRGELTINYAADAMAFLRSQGGAELDLSDISEMDGAGLQLLLLAHRDGGLRLVGASESVVDVLRLVGLTSLLEVPA